MYYSPGNHTYYFASNISIPLDAETISSRMLSRGIHSEIVDSNYLSYRFDPVKTELYARQVSEESVGINYDFFPIALYYSHLAWSNYCSAMIFNLLLLLSVQVLFGVAYRMTGLFFAAFMGGSFMGAFAASRLHCEGYAKRRYFLSEILILALHPLVAVVIYLLRLAGNLIIPEVIVLILILSAMLCGMVTAYQFPLAALLHGKSESKGTGGKLYSADLLGGWFGGSVLVAMLFPLLGFAGLLIISLLCKMVTSVYSVRCSSTTVKLY